MLPSKPALGDGNYGLGQVSVSFSAAKLGAVASQVFLFLLARNCRMLFKRFKPSRPPKPSKPLETCQTGSWSCQTRSCGKPSLSFRLLELPNYGLWQAKWFLFCCQTTGCGSQVFLFLLARNCQMLPANPQNPRDVPNRLLELLN